MTTSGGRPRYALVRFRYLFLAAMVFGGSLLILSLNSHMDIFLLNNPSNTLWLTHQYEIADSEDSFTIKTEGCTIPSLRPFDESVKQFSETPKNFYHCRHDNISLLENNDTHIWILKKNLHHYRVPNNYNISCCYKMFYKPTRIFNINAKDVDDRVQYGKCITFTDYIEVTNEFVKVSCVYKHRKLYEQFFLFARKKTILSYNEDSMEIHPNQTNSYNVIVLGIDAISRLNFYRTMPKTMAYLKKKGAIELLGYNKVGDNTFPNVIPMLLGIKSSDLKKTCWPNLKSTFDHCPFIWNWFKEIGYYTAFGEDSASLGTFNYQRYGFAGSPTDYYIRTFMTEAELNVANGLDFNAYLCLGNKYSYKVLLDYIESLTRTLETDKLFGFFWEVSMSHDYLNYPMMMDDNYEKFLRKLDNTKYLDNTVLILLSDHGIRWGEIRFTKQGRLEERLPLFHILMPPSFREMFNSAYSNLKNNRHRLTTPFDIHATLNDLIQLDSLTNDQIKIRSQKNYASNSGISLFLPIPRNRTCKMAYIDDHWCTCHKSYKLSTDIKEAHDAAFHLVKHLNLLIRDYPQCAKLKLAKILELSEMHVSLPHQDQGSWREFMVVVQTTPGDGVFEGTMRTYSHTWTSVGTVSRLNLYGDQSRCIQHYQLKLYCFCG